MRHVNLNMIFKLEIIGFQILIFLFSCNPVQKKSVSDLKVNSNGDIEWNFSNYENEVIFNIEWMFPDKWNSQVEKWNLYRQLKLDCDTFLQTTSSKSYTLNSNIHFYSENMKVRIVMISKKDTNYSNIYVVNYENPFPDISGIIYDTLNLKFKTNYVLYDKNGKIVKKGFDNKILFNDLELYDYYYVDAANYSNSYTFKPK